MARTTETNMFRGNPEMALQAVAMASRVLLEMAVAAEAENAPICGDSDPENFGATYSMLGGMLHDAHAVLLDAGACELEGVPAQ